MKGGLFLGWTTAKVICRLLSHYHYLRCRLRLKCDGTRAETRFLLSAQRTSPFNSGGGGVSSVDFWQVSCEHQPAGFVLLVQACVLQSCDTYWLPTPFSCFLSTSPLLRHRVPSHFSWTLPGLPEVIQVHSRWKRVKLWQLFVVQQPLRMGSAPGSSVTTVLPPWVLQNGKTKERPDNLTSRQFRPTNCRVTGQHAGTRSESEGGGAASYWSEVYVNVPANMTELSSKLQPTRCNISWSVCFYRRFTCFGRFLRASSGAHNSTYSYTYCQLILLLAASVDEMELRSIASTIAASSCIGWAYLKLYVQYVLLVIGRRNRPKLVERL